MQSELFVELEGKIEGLIEEVELLRLEISELREAKSALEQEQSQTEEQLKRMLGKFDRLNDSTSL
ncbi:cell division protein ZapB [Marinobacterium sp. AK62]|uniref:Cell division protein ZapB n=1 Tax=Marinobacterium alkalitolerans TaxID=1542925 RepID=A0ABS3Z8Y8_9GAMM|nr:cell division protein ZapB [Marinobacterium alkalitolerans]MBP0048137.1 cell division protein ZapB [Marinobacterium alkalitolerans]